MEKKIILRSAALADVAAVLAVQRASPGAAVWEAADYVCELKDCATLCLLAEDPVTGQVTGFLLGRMVADELEILNLAVRPDYRRLGIARRLVDGTLAEARARRIQKCWLEVRAANQAAREFYGALGFAENGRRRRYYRDPEDDAVVCVRGLAETATP